MNIIISKDESVRSVVLDFRDVVYGRDAEITLDDCIAILDKRYFVKAGEVATYENIIDYLTSINKNRLMNKILDILEREIRRNASKNAIKIPVSTTKIKMTMFDLSRLRDKLLFDEIKCLTIGKRQNKIIVSKPLWQNSVSLISVGIDRETNAFEIRREGTSNVDTIEELYEDNYVEGAGVADMIMQNQAMI